MTDLPSEERTATARTALGSVPAGSCTTGSAGLNVQAHHGLRPPGEHGSGPVRSLHSDCKRGSARRRADRRRATAGLTQEGPQILVALLHLGSYPEIERLATDGSSLVDVSRRIEMLQPLDQCLLLQHVPGAANQLGPRA